MVPDVRSCYLAMAALHTLYKPIPGKFKDYIAIPKANGYQPQHTTLVGPFGMPIEMQIRTAEMHKVAEAGVASHWMYKSSDDGKDVQLKTHQWLQSLLEIQSESGDALEFLEHIKVDLFPDEVYVFSPKGKIFALPKGATPIDFAYAVHTDVGNHCIGAKVDGEAVPLGTVLRNGNRVEILTDPQARPDPQRAGPSGAHARLPLDPPVPLRSREVGRRAVGSVRRPHVRRERAPHRAEPARRARAARRRSLGSRLQHRPHRDRAAREPGLYHRGVYDPGQEPNAPRARLPAPAPHSRGRTHIAPQEEAMKPISTPDAPAAIGTYSQAVRAGDTVYLSCQIP